MKHLRIISAALLSFLLSACGSDSSNSQTGARCSANSQTVNWALLLEADAEKLSDYNLFEQSCNPTTQTNSGGFPYDLTTALFTDYSTKYRFIFMPPGTSAEYSEDEALEFPVGSVLVKTFSVPKNTSLRGFESEFGFDGETLIETRLLIRKETGWVARPYVWNDEQTEAELKLSGKSIATSIVHNGEQLDFTYAVPDVATCKQCHQLSSEIDGEDTSRFAPIGPKARLLNKSITYADGEQNQLAYMIENQLLTGAPADLTTINTIPNFSDSTDLSLKTSSELESLAKGYLDINCAHCHRRTVTETDIGSDGKNDTLMDGKAGYSALLLEYWRDYGSHSNMHGECKIPIAYSVQGLAFDIVPGDSSKSIMPYRMTLQTAKRMPEAGRDLVHQEGVELINAWIDSMASDNCGQ